MPDNRFGAVAVALGWATVEQVDALLEVQEHRQRALGCRPGHSFDGPRLGDLLVERGVLSQHQRRDVAEVQGEIRRLGRS